MRKVREEADQDTAAGPRAVEEEEEQEKQIRGDMHEAKPKGGEDA